MPHFPPKNCPTIGFLPLLRYPKSNGRGPQRSPRRPSTSAGRNYHPASGPLGEAPPYHHDSFKKWWPTPHGNAEKPRTKSPNRKVRSMALVLANAFQTSKIEHFLEAESQDINISHRWITIINEASWFHSDDWCSRYIIVTIMNLLMITIPPHPGEVEGQPLPSKTPGVLQIHSNTAKKKIEKEENIRKPTKPKTDRKAWNPWNPKRMPFVGLEKPGPLGLFVADFVLVVMLPWDNPLLTVTFKVLWISLVLPPLTCRI